MSDEPSDDVLLARMRAGMPPPSWMVEQNYAAAIARIRELEKERDEWKQVAGLYGREEFTALLHQRALSAEERVEMMDAENAALLARIEELTSTVSP